MLAPPGIWYRAAIMTTARPRLAFSASLALAMVLAAAAIGCSKKEDSSTPKCFKGELQVSVKIAGELRAGSTPERFDCPTRLSTTGARPPDGSWVGDLSPFWGPELIVQLDLKQTEPVRKAGEDKCIYSWSQGCGGLDPQQGKASK